MLDPVSACSCQSSSLSLVDISNTLFGFSVLRCREDSLLRSLTDTAIKVRKHTLSPVTHTPHHSHPLSPRSCHTLSRHPNVHESHHCSVLRNLCAYAHTNMPLLHIVWCASRKALNTSQLPDVVTLAWSAAHASALLGFASEGLLDHVASRVLMEWQQVGLSTYMSAREGVIDLGRYGMGDSRTTWHKDGPEQQVGSVIDYGLLQNHGVAAGRARHTF